MKKVIVSALALVVFLVHVTCTILYNAPVNPMSIYYRESVSRYIDPLFSQTWLLFAPDPATSGLKLWYRTYADHRWGHWNDPIEPVLRKHQRMRFTHNAKLLYVYGNIAKELSSKSVLIDRTIRCKSAKADCLKVKSDSLISSAEFRLALKYVKRDLINTSKKIDSIQLMVVQIFPNQFSERLSKKPFSHVNTTELSPVIY